MPGAGLSPYLRDSTYFFQADGQKSLDKILRFGRSVTVEVAKTCKGVAEYASQKSESAFLAVSVGSDCPARKIRVQSSRQTMLLPPVMFQVTLSWG